MSIFREAYGASIICALSSNTFLNFPDEQTDFILPQEYSSISRQALSIEGVKHESQVLVSWYSDTDPENPYNWSSAKKTWVSTLLFAYTFTAYLGSSIYTASIPGIVEEFGVSQTVASLGLSLYVAAYGLAPMILAPLSEIPAIGRNPPYSITFSLFALLSIAVPLVDNFAGLLVLRFLLGLLSSPALATGGASYGDFFQPEQMQYVIVLWGGGATLAPALGPLVAGFAVNKMGWRWSAWEMLWLSAPIAVFMIFALPETSSDTILLKRARRLRKLTGRHDLVSESEIRQKEKTARQIAFDALIKPWEINALDPAVLFTTVYMALTYGIYYSFFESFPLVFRDVYGFGLGSVGLAFLSILTGLAVAVVLLLVYIRYISPRRLAKLDPVPPEARIWPGLWATFLIPVGLFLYAWTARESIHWVVCMTGVAISMCGVFIITQCMFIYLPFTYPRYVGSLFAANGCARALFAAGAVLFSPPMFDALGGVSGGVSLLAGCSVVCIFGMYGLYFFGERMRKRSRFAE